MFICPKDFKVWKHLVCGIEINIASGGASWKHHIECSKKEQFKVAFQNH
jgi:hypothetical protein